MVHPDVAPSQGSVCLRGRAHCTWRLASRRPTVTPCTRSVRAPIARGKADAAIGLLALTMIVYSMLLCVSSLSYWYSTSADRMLDIARSWLSMNSMEPDPLP